MLARSNLSRTVQAPRTEDPKRRAPRCSCLPPAGNRRGFKGLNCHSLIAGARIILCVSIAAQESDSYASQSDPSPLRGSRRFPVVNRPNRTQMQQVLPCAWIGTAVLLPTRPRWALVFLAGFPLCRGVTMLRIPALSSTPWVSRYHFSYSFSRGNRIIDTFSSSFP